VRFMCGCIFYFCVKMKSEEKLIVKYIEMFAMCLKSEIILDSELDLHL
jgi:hypothetical protein